MASRLITIEVDAKSGGYEAAVARIQQVNQRMTRDATAGAQQTAGALRVWETQLTGVGNALRTLATGFVGLQAINFLTTFTAFAEKLSEVSKRTKVLVEDLHALERIGKLEGATFDEITTGLRFLSKAIAESSDAGSEQAKIFKLLGVDAQGIIKSGGGVLDVMLKLSAAFRDNLDPTNQVLVAQKFLGRSSENLINILALGPEKIQAMIDEQKRLGVITTETANAADEARDKWGQFFSVLQAKIGGPVVDGLTDIINTMETVKRLVTDNLRLFGLLGGVNLGKGAAGIGALAGGAVTQPGAEGLEDVLKSSLKTEGAHTTGRIDVARALADAKKADSAAETASKKAQREAEAAAKKAIEDAKRFTESIQKQNEAISLQIIEMTKGEAAADEWKIQLLEGEAAQLKLTDAQKKHIATQRDLVTGLRDQKEHLEAVKREIEFAAQAEADLAAIRAGTDRDDQILRQRKIDAVEIEKQLRDVQADRLAASGQTVAADRARLESQIQYLEAVRKREEGLGNVEKANLHAEQIKLVTDQMTHLGEVTINIGRTIAQSVGDAFEGVILGTSKLGDVGKNLMNALVRDVAQFFTNVLVKKLKFEELVFSNMRGLVPQANQALAAGAASVPGGDGGGVMSLLFGGGAPAGVEGPLMANGSFFSGGGGILQTLGIGTLGQDIAGFMGTSGGGQGILGGIGTFISDIFGGNSILGSFGGPLLGGAGSLLLSAFTGGFKKSQIGSTLGQAAGAGIGSIFGPIGTLLGGVVGNFIGSLFNQTPNPTAILRARFSGIFFDALEGVFKPGTVSVGKIRSQDIKGSQVANIKSQVQTALETASTEWTNILNLFPQAARERIIPTLEGTNANLNNAFGRLKFSEGGKRNIEQELRDFTGKESAMGFFHAMRSSIGTGFQATLEQLGLPDVGQLAFEQFNRGVLHRGNKAAGGVFEFAGQTNESAAANIKAIADAAGLTAGLAEVSPRGVKPFLTAADNEFLRRELETLFTGSSGDAFTKNATALKEKLKPVMDFLQQAVGESTTLFGNGIVAALDAATASDAITNFQKTLGEGTKELLFKGITEAFLSSGQFNDLLAPIQKTIRDFAQQAIASGQTPDLGAFRSALLPQIEALSARGDVLGPLLAELQKLGLDFKDALKIFSGGASKGPTTIKIDITVQQRREGTGGRVGRSLTGALRAELRRLG